MRRSLDSENNADASCVLLQLRMSVCCRLAEEVQVIPAEHRVTATHLARSSDAGVVLDVRPVVQYNAAHISGKNLWAL